MIAADATPALPAPLPALLGAWALPLADARAARAPSGLIQTTYLVGWPDGRRVVAQRHHAVFDPPAPAPRGEALLADIAAVTARVAAAGLATPRLVPRPDGSLGWRDDDGRLWRVLSFVRGRTLDRVDAPARAAAAAELVARFHAALAGWPHTFAFTRPGAHDTEAHLARLASHAGAPASQSPGVPDAVRRLADAILAAAARRPALAATPARVTHGDLKISNVLFVDGPDGSDGPDGPDGSDASAPAATDAHAAHALIDLDTVGRLTLAYELGDALRSWCNPLGEDTETPRFDLDVFTAAVKGYARGVRAAGVDLAPGEAESFAPGTITVAIELASRFCTDAFEDRYFGWNSQRFPSRREHNRVRAAGQLALAQGVLARRADAEAAVVAVFGRPQP